MAAEQRQQEEESTSPANDEYYRELLSRVDSTIAQTHKVTSSGAPAAYSHIAGDQQQHQQPLWVRVLKEHSIIGIYYHENVENEFTKPLKLYFFIVSVLWCILFSLQIKLATEFGDWLVITFLVHFVHWGQRALFHKFQNSLLLWPLLAAMETFGVFFADFALLIKGGKWAWRRLFSLGFSSYIIGFLFLEAAALWHRARRREKASLSMSEEQQQLEDALTADTDEYSTL